MNKQRVNEYSKINEEKEESLQVVENQLSKVEIIKNVAALSSTSIFNRILMTGNLFVGALALSGLGKSGLEASGYITPTTLAILNSSTGVINSVGVSTGICMRDRKPGEVGNYFQQGLLLSLLVTLPAVALTAATPAIYSHILSNSDSSIIMGDFLYPYLLVVPANIFLTNLQDISLGIGDNKSVLLSAITSQFLGAFFGYCFVQGKLGMPKLGSAGYAYMNAISTWMTNIGYFLYMKLNKKYDVHRLFFSGHTNRVEAFKTLLEIGWPIGLMLLIERSVLLADAIISSRLGSDALAAQEIVMQYIFFLIVPMYGLSRGLGISTTKMARKPQGAKMIYLLGAGAAVGISLIAAGIYNGIPIPLIEAFSHQALNNNTISMAKDLFIVNGVTSVFDATRIVTNGCLRGFEETMFSLSSSGIFMIASVFISVLFAFESPLGVNGIYIGRMIGVLLSLLYLSLGLNNRLQGEPKAFPPKLSSVKACFFSGRNRSNHIDVISEVAEVEEGNNGTNDFGLKH